MVLGLFPPIPVAFDDPHQLQCYPRLDMRISPRRAVYSLGAFGWAALVEVPGRVVESVVCCCVVYLCLSRVSRSIANRSRAHSLLR